MYSLGMPPTQQCMDPDASVPALHGCLASDAKRALVLTSIPRLLVYGIWVPRACSPRLPQQAQGHAQL